MACRLGVRTMGFDPKNSVVGSISFNVRFFFFCLGGGGGISIESQRLASGVPLGNWTNLGLGIAVSLWCLAAHCLGNSPVSVATRLRSFLEIFNGKRFNSETQVHSPAASDKPSKHQTSPRKRPAASEKFPPGFRKHLTKYLIASCLDLGMCIQERLAEPRPLLVVFGNETLNPYTLHVRLMRPTS